MTGTDMLHVPYNVSGELEEMGITNYGSTLKSSQPA